MKTGIKLQRFDFVALAFMGVLGLFIGILLWRGKPASPQVSNFSWAEKKAGADDKQFTLTFNTPMDRQSVEENLLIKPALPGKISWSGRKMTYTLTELPLYEESYSVRVSEARGAREGQILEQYIGEFETRDRAFVYLGVEGEEQGRLILYNLSKQEKALLTPSDLIVTEFEPYTGGDRILFLASARNSSPETKGQQLYTVTTGLNYESSERPESLSQVKQVLDAREYQNLKFDLSANGKTIVVQRAKQNNPGDFGLWVIPERGKAYPLNLQGAEFRVSPNGEEVAVVQKRGIAIVPLKEKGGKVKFLSGYDRIVGFSPDSESKLLVKYNEDETRSLFLVNEEGSRKLLDTEGSILNCEYEPKQRQTLYCLNTEAIEEEGTLSEEPYLAAIDLPSGESISLLALPNYPEVKMSISPDGIAILFDQIVTEGLGTNNSLTTEDGIAIASAQLWLLPLPEIPTTENPNRIPPEELIPGFRPQWLP